MADLNGKLGQLNTAVVLIDAGYPLVALNNAMKTATTKTITPKQGYLSKFEIVEELRTRLHDDYRTKAPDPSLEDTFQAIRVDLDKQKPMLELAKVSSSFDPLEKYMEILVTSHPGVFNPPLQLPFKTDLHDQVYSIPNTSKNDIRRYGQVILFDKFESVVYQWLVNNSPLFGFLLYEDLGLYYLGVPEIQKIVLAKTLQKTLNKFQRSTIAGSAITLTAAAVAAASQPLPPPPPLPPSGTATSKVVILSTGLSNGMNDLDSIEKQFKLLQTKQCKVFVLGVTNDPPTTPYDLSKITQQSVKLQDLVKTYGFTYCGDFTPSTDKVHPKYSEYFNKNVKPVAGTVDFIIGDSIATGIANSGFSKSRNAGFGSKSSDDKGISKVGAKPSEILGYLNELDAKLTPTPPATPPGSTPYSAGTVSGTYKQLSQLPLVVQNAINGAGAKTLVLVREFTNATRTGGTMWYNKGVLGVTVEDAIRNPKVPKQTCIPDGTFNVVLDTTANEALYRCYVQFPSDSRGKFKSPGVFPRVGTSANAVELTSDGITFEGIRIHNGASEGYSAGCIIYSSKRESSGRVKDDNAHGQALTRLIYQNSINKIIVIHAF